MTAPTLVAGLDRSIVFSPGPSPLGRYVNREYDEPGGGRPAIHIAHSSAEVIEEARRKASLNALKVSRPVVMGRDGFLVLDDIKPGDPFSSSKWAFDGTGRGTRRITGADLISYVTTPSVQLTAGATTAASTSIQVLPSAVSPLFAGAGAATGGVGAFWYPGRSIRLILFGIGTTSTSPGSTIFQWNAATSQNVTTGNSLGSNTLALVASQSNIAWMFDGYITCRSVGTGGTLWGQGSIVLAALFATNVPNLIPASAPATATIDTTSNSAINFLVTLGATTVSFTVELGFWQILN